MSNLNEQDIAEYNQKKEENEPVIQNNGLPEKLTNKNNDMSPVTTLAIMINNKQDKINEIEKAMQTELECELTYLHKANTIRVNPAKIKDDLGLTKLLTEKQTQAHIEESLKVDFDKWKTAKANTSILLKQLDLINDRISLEKYAIKMELKKE